MRMFSKHYNITYRTGIKMFGVSHTFVVIKSAEVSFDGQDANGDG